MRKRTLIIYLIELLVLVIFLMLVLIGNIMYENGLVVIVLFLIAIFSLRMYKLLINIKNRR